MEPSLTNILNTLAGMSLRGTANTSPYHKETPAKKIFLIRFTAL